MNTDKMTAKEYCSTVCGAKCCRKHSGMISPAACPMLTADNLCAIYKKRLGFEFTALKADRSLVTGVCSKVADFLPGLPPEVREQCCYQNPELLNR